MLEFAGIGVPPQIMPIQFLFDPGAPYFEHLCLNVRFLGFGL
jgi:hypothetical protein